MKKIILLVVALLVLIGAAVGGFLLFGPKHGDEQAEAEKKPPEPSGPPVYVNVGPMMIPVINAKRIEQNIVLTVSLQVASESVRDEVADQRPRLIDAYVAALYGSVEQGHVVDGQILNIPEVKQKLVEATGKVLKPGLVQDVLIQSVSQRPAF
ncbi:hypothetical protein [Oleisolibacter albus]|uniref:hypothetical protein n=1 Tax=Oleisolibacter albus TaxID=2171757 RepID=UPI000DF268EA|nr:hypothetical protein [Oleisolibacter albus]